MTVRVSLAVSSALLALTLFSAPSARAASDKEIAQLIAQFSDDKKASAALEQVTAIGEPAVDQLTGLALEKQETTNRGWAIAALGFIGGDKALAALKKISEDGGESGLVRTWAYAARIAQTKTLDELGPLANMANSYPALKRPVGQRVLAIVNAQPDASAEDLIKLGQSHYQLQQSLVPAIIGLGPDPLIKVMQQSKDDNTRRMAAAYLGNVAQQQGTEAVASKVIDALRFSPGASRVPWDGGALFIPSLQYDKDSARALVAQLIRWHVWADTRGKKQEQNQLHNNLRGVGLANMAGYRSPGWQNTDTPTWLKTWGQVVGKSGIEEILREQGLMRNGRYRAVLDGLK